MKKGTNTLLTLLMSLTLIIALQACGGGGGGGDKPNNTEETEETDNDSDNDNDNDNNTNNTTIESKIWLTANCIQDNSGVYFKTLYQFNTSGEVLEGYQDFQDTSCTTPTTETVWPSNTLTTYTKGASDILQDGATGTLITLAFSSNAANVTVDGYYTITDQNTLCFTTNLSINTGDFSYQNIPSPPIDYDNCLTVHSEASNSNPDPIPDTNTQDSVLLGMWWLRSICYASDTGGTSNVILKFTPDSKLLYATLPYESNDCSGTPSDYSDFIEFDTPTTYEDLGEMTLPIGTLGHGLILSNSSDTIQGYYIFDANKDLCFSHNLGFGTGTSSTEIDYDNCLVKLN
jgi:hypothetical protein